MSAPTEPHSGYGRPRPSRVEVIGDFNEWNDGWALSPDPSGIWSGHVPGVVQGDVYKYSIVPGGGGVPLEKADPYAFRAEEPPRTGSVVWDLAYEWGDQKWMAIRELRPTLSTHRSRSTSFTSVRGAMSRVAIGPSPINLPTM